MTEIMDSGVVAPGPKGDCGCGCNGQGDCANEKTHAKKGLDRNRRSLLVGAGTVAFVSTLVNRRAFAAGACDPVSTAMSMNASVSDPKSSCTGLSATFWQNHVGCAGAALGFTPSWLSNDYTRELTIFLKSSTLGSRLTNLHTIDPQCATQSFGHAFTNPGSDASHWACAILNAMSPTLNRSYGYTLMGLNDAINNAYKQNVPCSMILAALITLESDAGSASTGCANLTLSSTVS